MANELVAAAESVDASGAGGELVDHCELRGRARELNERLRFWFAIALIASRGRPL